jgi:hypothetical protein
VGNITKASQVDSPLVHSPDKSPNHGWRKCLTLAWGEGLRAVDSLVLTPQGLGKLMRRSLSQEGDCVLVMLTFGGVEVT